MKVTTRQTHKEGHALKDLKFGILYLDRLDDPGFLIEIDEKRFLVSLADRDVPAVLSGDFYGPYTPLEPGQSITLTQE